MLKFIDSLFDRAAKRLAENMCCNMDVAQKHRMMREEQERNDMALSSSRLGSCEVLGTHKNAFFVA
jgi:hypothetical protein